MRSRLVVIVFGLGACDLILPPPKPPKPPPAPTTREGWTAKLRGELGGVTGDACAKAEWLAKRIAASDGLEQEVAEELEVEQVHACKGDAPSVAQTPAGPSEPTATADPPVAGPCTHERADIEVRRATKTRPVPPAMIEGAFASCFAGRVKTCQAALDAGGPPKPAIDGALTCWEHDAWPEVPAGTDAQQPSKTGVCLHELKAVVADLEGCAAKKGGERDNCVAPYVGFSAACGLIDATALWSALPVHADLERIAKADAARSAAHEAELAKEAARCHGRSTLAFATALDATWKPAELASCKYQVVGRVISHNNVYVELVDPTSGKAMHMLKTHDAFPDGTVVSGRTAAFDGVEQVELADGTNRSVAVFKLLAK